MRWVEFVKITALVWIFLNHLSERLFGFPYIANPSSQWPPFSARVAQLEPLHGYGLWGMPVNLLRWIGWTGDQGVHLFLIVSGFGLTWGILRKHGGEPLPMGSFLRRRANRIYPLWWGAHVMFLLFSLTIGFGLSLHDPRFYLSLLGIRALPILFYYCVPSWWFIGLIIQLYLVYPLLLKALRRLGPFWFLVAACIVGFGVRTGGFLFLPKGFDKFSMGIIFITRLPEFAFGIALAAWMIQTPQETRRRLSSKITLAGAFAVYALGTVFSLTWTGMVLALFMLGVGAFVLLYRLFDSFVERPGGLYLVPTWISQHTYSLYLVHQPIIDNLVPKGLVPGTELETMAKALAAALLSVVTAIVLERSVEGVQRVLSPAWRYTWRYRWRFVSAAFVTAVMLLAGELIVRRVAPQEVLGWGERPSLEPHEEFGWRLRPSTTTRLRWETYDYTLTANSLGFPGPEYQEIRGPNSVRIMTIGDAFTSAEGVDTQLSWPRVLEHDLAAALPDRAVEVLNFGITAYGPNQYAAVLKTFVPRYRPDVIVIGAFVNDFEDVLITNKTFQDSIGFDQPPVDSWWAIIRIKQLRHLIKERVVAPIYELVLSRPAPYRYFLGQFRAMDIRFRDSYKQGWQQASARYSEIAEVAASVGARVVILMIPAPVQVCEPKDLRYYPRNVNLQDTARFDFDQPQRGMREIATNLKFVTYDLRPVLRALPTCPYQPWNLHWTSIGHRTVASFLAKAMIDDGLVPGRP